MMCIMTSIKPIGPTTWRAVMAIRHRWWHCNGTMTYRDRLRRGICGRVHKNRMREMCTKRYGKPHWFTRPDNALRGSYEHARLAHIEMERMALRRPF